MSKQVDEKVVEAVQAIFKTYDRNKNGYLEMDELTQLMKSMAKHMDRPVDSRYTNPQ